MFIADLAFCSEMEVYTNSELADAHLMYGLADDNGAAVHRCIGRDFLNEAATTGKRLKPFMVVLGNMGY